MASVSALSSQLRVGKLSVFGVLEGSYDWVNTAKPKSDLQRKPVREMLSPENKRRSTREEATGILEIKDEVSEKCLLHIEGAGDEDDQGAWLLTFLCIQGELALSQAPSTKARVICDF